MRPIFGLLAILLVVLANSMTSGQEGNPAPNQGVSLTGEVTLVAPKKGTPIKDASRVVEWMVPREGPNPAAFTTSKKVYRMVQHDKKFEPNFLVVPVGSVVDFPNLDPWFHNVFSLYRGKKFDLGLYEAGSNKKVRFDRPGASYIFCNIHPEMNAVVLTVDSEYFGASDKSGHITIANVPAGAYIFHVWYENATPGSLQKLERTVVISEESHQLPPVSITVTKQSLAGHKNKYGRDYDPDAASPVY